MVISFVFLCALIHSVLSHQDLYVTAFPNGPGCPDDEYDALKCEPLSYYTNRMEEYFVENTTFYFMEGVHRLPNEALVFSDVNNVALVGVGDITYNEHESVAQSTSVLECSEGLGGIEFYSSEDITITKITLLNCSTTSRVEDASGSLLIIDSEHVYLQSVSIQNSRYHGLYVNNTFYVYIFECSFHKNGLAGTSWNVFVAFFNTLDVDEISGSHYFTSIESTNITAGSFGGLSIYFAQQEYEVGFFIKSSKISHNVNNLNVISNSCCFYSLHFVLSECSHSILTGYRHLHNSSCGETAIIPMISIKESNFFQNSVYAFFLGWTGTDDGDLIIENSNFTDNVGTLVSAVSIEQSRRLTDRPSGELFVAFKGLIFSGNIHNETKARLLGYSELARFTVVINNVIFSNVDNCRFIDNQGSAFLLLQSRTLFIGENTFQNNNATLGGAICLVSDSFILLRNDSKLFFIDNNAWSYGGAILIAKYIPRIFSHEGNRGLYTDCFYQLLEPIIESPLGEREMFVFQGNRAGIAGSTVYGGVSDNCYSRFAAMTVKTDFFVNISSFIDQPGDSVISSDPVGVCFCDYDTIDCTEKSKSFAGFPGTRIDFSVVAIGDRNGTSIGLIQVNNARLSTKNTTLISSTCTKLSYYLQVKDSDVKKDIIHVSVITNEAVSNVLYVDVEVVPCPVGYKLSQFTGVCECIKVISEYGVCFDTEMVVERAGSVWIGYDDELNCTLVNSNCPFDYCLSSNENVSTTSPDEQCALNRAGRLCGACDKNMTLVLGSNACRECFNDAYILSVILFALAGVALVAFLFLVNFTVSVGTINGLVFFANVIKLYEPLFRADSIPVLSQFISWINLDFGVEICFHANMKACEKHSVQFIFPFYLWGIIVTIIIVSKYSSKVAKLVGKNGIPVLATLLLLSFNKILRTVILAFSISYIECEEDTMTLLYWYVDPTVEYLKGCHLVLFIFALLILIFLITPYVLFLLLYPLLEVSSPKVRRQFSWFLIRLKPFFDAYRGPHSKLFGFWPGLLLVIRVLLALVVAISEDRNIPFTILLLVSLGLVSILSFGKVYSSRFYLHSLETVLLLGLAFLAYLFNSTTCQKETRSLFQLLSMAAVLALGAVLFIVILVYHVVKFSSIWKFFAKIVCNKLKKTRETKASTSSQMSNVINDSEQKSNISNDDNDREEDLDFEMPVFNNGRQINFAKYRESLFSNYTS